MIKRFLLPLAFLVLACGGLSLRAQTPGELDPAYNPPTSNMPVQAVVIQSDGKAVIGGQFTSINGVAVSAVVRLNTDGTLDSTFANATAGNFIPGDTANVSTLTLQPDGKILVTAYGVTTYQFAFVRINTDGSLDTAFSVTLGSNGPALQTVAVQSDGHIIIGGVFDTLNGSPAYNIARLNAGGSTDTTFSAPLLQSDPPVGLFGFVQGVQIQTDGKFVVVGDLSHLDAPDTAGLARLNTDGSLDSTFTVTDVANVDFQAVALQPDGNVLLSGNFTTLDGQPIANLARFSATDGSLDTTLNTGTLFSGGPASVAVQSDGKILCTFNDGGYGEGLAGPPLVRLNTDGSLDREFAPGFFLGSGSNGYGVAVQADGQIIATGAFLLPNQQTVGVARLIGPALTAATTVSLVVPGTANPWLAPVGATDPGGDSIPAEAPVRVTGLSLTPGATLFFSAAGLVNFDGSAPSDPPDGSPGYFNPHAAENGLSGVNAQVDCLLGVFVNDAVADPTNANAPAALDFETADANSVSGGIDYTSIQPLLGQVFFIGDGVNAGGTIQQVTVPAGATHLVLGTLDGSGWYNNTGSFNVTVTAGAGGGNTALTQTTFLVNGSNQPSTVAVGAAITFTAIQGASPSSGVYVRVQATTSPNTESTWTDLTDTTNGGAGFLKGDGSGNYTLTTTQYPTGSAIYFRVISAAPNQTDSISNIVGSFNLANANTPQLAIGQDASTPDAPNASVALVGDQITYTLFVRNYGTATATNVKVIDVLPPSLQLQSADAGYTIANGNYLTWTFPQLSPTTNGPLTLKLVASVAPGTPIGTVISNNGYSVQADGTGIIQGTDLNNTTVIPPLEVIISGSGSTVAPGQTVTYQVQITNKSPSKIKGINISVPVPNNAQLVSDGFLDAMGQQTTAPVPAGGGANPVVNGTNLLYYIGTLKAGEVAHIQLTLQVPYDFDPTAPLVLSGPKVTTKTSVGGVNSFTLPDTTTPLSGKGPSSPPLIGFAKTAVDSVGLFQITLAEPKLAKHLGKALEAIALNPALLAQFAQIYPGLATLNLSTATVNDVLSAIDPDVSYESSDTAGQLATATVKAPAAGKPTYIAFILPYSNDGGATASNVVIQDRVPEGTSIFEPGAAAYNGSVIINGQPGNPSSGGNLEILDNGSTLRFHIGDLKAGKSGFVIYKVRVLGPGEAGAPSPDSVITSSGSVLSSTSLSNTYIGQPDGQDLTVVGTYAYYMESTQYTSNTTPIAEGVVYEIYYVNTGTRASKIFEIDDPVPAGLQYDGFELLDGNHKPLPSANLPAGAVDAPADPTSGTVVFHVSDFSPKGKIKAGESGYIRVYFTPLSTALADGHAVFVHSPVVPGSSYATSARRTGGAVPRTAGRPSSPRTLAAGSTPGISSTNATRVDDTAVSKMFLVEAAPMAVVEGVIHEVLVAMGSLNDTPENAGQIIVTLPPGMDYNYVVGDVAPENVQTAPDAASGGTQVQITPYTIPAHGAIKFQVRFTPHSGSASQAPLVFPNTQVNYFNQSISLQTGPVHVRVLTVSQANAIGAMRGQIASSALTDIGATSPSLQEFTDNIGIGSRTLVVSGASAVSTNSGVVLLPLLGSDNGMLVMGPSSQLVLGNGIDNETSYFSDFQIASGPASNITIGAVPAPSGAMLPAQDAGSLVANIRSAAANNAVAISAANLLNGGAVNLISQDGNGLISQDGNSLSGKTISDVVSNDGGSFGAGRSNTNSLIGNAGGALIGNAGGTLIGNAGGTLLANAPVVSNDGGSLLATHGGYAMAASGANIIGLNGSGLVGTPDNTVALHATASGNLVQMGSTSGLVSEGGAQ